MGYDIPADHHGPLPRNPERGADDGPQTREYWINRIEHITPIAAMPFAHIMAQSIGRANRWHNGNMDEWSPLEWAGAMCGEAGECANAAKKLKRLEDGIASINEGARNIADVNLAKQAVAKEAADTILYAVLVAARVGIDLQQTIREVFNKKSEEYGFPERL